MSLPDIARRIQRTVAEHHLLPEPPATLLLLVSGGADSVALARLFPVLYPDFDYKILHVNHGLRGASAAADEDFVRRLAEELGLGYAVRHLDLPAVQAASGGNLEALGRERRYALAAELLEKLTSHSETASSPEATSNLNLLISPEAPTLPTESPQTSPAGRIVTAHTANDQVETFLMRVIKGGGPAAWAGMPCQRGNIIRPLLDVPKAELLEWLVEQNYAWREDASNADTHYLRAYVRHTVLPSLQGPNPRLISTVNNNLRILADQADFVQTAAAAYADDPWAAPHRAVVREALRQAYQAAGGQPRDLTFELIEQLRLQGSSAGFALDLPGGIHAAWQPEPGRCVFSPPPAAPAAALSNFAAELTLAEPLATPLGTLRWTVVPPADFSPDPLNYARRTASADHLILDADVLRQVLRNFPQPDECQVDGQPAFYQPDGQPGLHQPDRHPAFHRPNGRSTPNQPGEQPRPNAPSSPDLPGLQVSSLQPGDRICPLGLDGHSKLVSDVLIDRHIPRNQRGRLLKLTAGGQLVWLIGIQADDRFRVRADSQRLFSIIRELPNSDEII